MNDLALSPEIEKEAYRIRAAWSEFERSCRKSGRNNLIQTCDNEFSSAIERSVIEDEFIPLPYDPIRNRRLREARRSHLHSMFCLLIATLFHIVWKVKMLPLNPPEVSDE